MRLVVKLTFHGSVSVLSQKKRFGGCMTYNCRVESKVVRINLNLEFRS